MARCTNKYVLQVHHIRRDGGNGLDNAQVLCIDCHAETDTYAKPGTRPPEFSQDTKDKAIKRAGNQCECMSTRGCH